MEITFSELPNNDLTYMGITSDMVKSIMIDNVPVGIVYLSEGYDENTSYIEWIEFLSVFQSKHLLRPVMKALYREYGKLFFESDEELKIRYAAIGSVQTDYDADREMYSWEYAS